MNETLGVALPICGLALALPGCSAGDSGNGGGGGGAPVPFEEYCQQYAEMACEIAERCDCLGGFSIELCVSFMRGDCQDDVEAPVDAGRMSYDPAQAGHCIAALENIASDCSTENDDWPESCDRMLVGMVPAGEACDGSDECEPALECVGDACTPMPRENEPCLDGTRCGDGQFCGSDDLCHGYRGHGEPCPEGDHACDDDLYCDSRSDECQPYLRSGEDCAHAGYACDDDLYCSPSDQTCLPYPTSGQSCEDSGGDCADDLYCDAAQTCQPQGAGDSPCGEDEECLSYDCIDDVCEEDDVCPF